MKLRKPGTFKKNNQAAIGHRGGGGRPPDWLKAKCQKIVDREKLVEFLGRVGGGVVDCEVKDRLRAIEILMDRGWGKPGQSVEVAGPVDADGNPTPLPIILPVAFMGKSGEVREKTK